MDRREIAPMKEQNNRTPVSLEPESMPFKEWRGGQGQMGEGLDWMFDLTWAAFHVSSHRVPQVQHEESRITEPVLRLWPGPSGLAPDDLAQEERVTCPLWLAGHCTNGRSVRVHLLQHSRQRVALGWWNLGLYSSSGDRDGPGTAWTNPGVGSLPHTTSTNFKRI